MVQALDQSKRGVTATYFCNSDFIYASKIIDSADIFILCRTRYSDEIGRLIAKIKCMKKIILYDIDDLIFNPDYAHLIKYTVNYHHTWDSLFSYISRLGATLRLCDGVITTNTYLAEKIYEYCQKPTFIIPNFLNDEQLTISKYIFDQKLHSGFARSDEIDIGYFSGTPTHNKDFSIVSGALDRLLETDRRVRVRIVGFLNADQLVLKHKERIQFFPLQDFISLQQSIGQVEINIVPLQNNIFTNCKSELKYFEAGIVGTVSIASPTFVYQNAIRDGVNGFLSGTSEWFEKIETLSNKISTDYESIAQKVFTETEQKYAWYNQIELIEKTLFATYAMSVDDRISSSSCHITAQHNASALNR